MFCFANQLTVDVFHRSAMKDGINIFQSHHLLPNLVLWVIIDAPISCLAYFLPPMKTSC